MIDTKGNPVYTESDLLRIAEETAKRTAADTLSAFLKGMNLEKPIEKLADMPEGDNGMATLKARIGDAWITANSVQQLVDKALNHTATQHDHLSHDTPTVRDYCNTYMATFRAEGTIAGNTRIGYLGYLRNHIFPAIGDLRIHEITAETVQDYINRKSGALSVSTIKKHMELLVQIFDSAVDDGLIAKNPFKNKRLKIFGKDSIPTIAYTEEEFKAIESRVLPHLHGSDLLYAGFTLYAGMRLGEICALTWEDVDLEQRLVYVTKSVSWAGKNQGNLKKPKSDNGRRIIIMVPQLYALLSTAERTGRYLIHSPRSEGDKVVTHQVMTRMRERINRIARENGVDFLFGNRIGRHTVATFMNNADVDEKTITSQIGHHDIQFTRKQYMNAQMRQMQRAMGKLGDYMANIG